LGPYEIESLLSTEEEWRATVYRVRLEPSQKTQPSWHEIAEEFYFILRGTGTAFVDSEPYEIETGDFLRLPPGTRHSFATGADALEFLNIHVPGCRPDRDTYFDE
jgi:mannose-6-phosphate isomerase-like protein (cupin superfamily)